MSRTFRTFLCFWTLGTGGVLPLGGVRGGESPDPRLEKVLADWQKRQDRIETIQYQVRGKHKVPKGAYDVPTFLMPGSQHDRQNPPEDLVGPVSFTLVLDFGKQRYHRDIREQVFNLTSGKLVSQVMKDTFNGSVMKCFTPREENPSLGDKVPEMTVVSGNMKNGAFRINYYPIFFGHGRIYTAMEQIIPGQLRNKPDPDYLYVHGTGVHEGRTCLVVRTQTLKMASTSFDEYWVDAARESAIVRYVTSSGGKPASEITIRYRGLHDGWLPDSWHWIVYTKGKTLYSEDMHVEKLVINPTITDSDFEMEIKPGMLVEERTDYATRHPIATPKSTLSVYRAKENGAREEVPDPYHRRGDQYGDHGRRKNLWIWSWLLLPLGGIAGFLLWVRRRRRAR